MEQLYTRAQTRRPKPAGRNNKKGSRDPYLFTLCGQAALCAVLLLCCYALRDARPSFWPPESERLLISLMTDPARQTDFPEGVKGWFSSFFASREDGSPAASPRPDPKAAADPSLDPDLPSDSGDTDVPLSPFGEALIYEGEDNPSPPEDSASGAEKAPEESGGPLRQAEPDSAPITDRAKGMGLSLAGAGGWFSAAGEKKSPPEDCSLSPILMTAPVFSPISGVVSSFYGFRVHPLTGSDDFHRGLDIAAPEGGKIYTPLPGRVAEVDSSPIYGNYIRLDNGGGIETTFCHCSSVEARVGENLRAGEWIANVGSTGISTGPHVHFELSRNGVYYNPAWVLEGFDGRGI